MSKTTPKKPDKLVQQVQKVVQDALDALLIEKPVIHYPEFEEARSPKRPFRDSTMVHAFSELVFVARGEADILMENKALACSKGAFLVIPSQVRHAAGACSFWERPDVEQCNSDTLWLIAYTSGVRLHFSYSRGEINAVSSPIFVPDRHLIVLLELLIDETKNERPSERQFIATYLNLIYSRLSYGLRLDSVVVANSETGISAHETALLRASPIERAVSFIDRNFDEKITLDDVAHAAYVSRAQLTLLFRREREQSVLDYITHCRLNMAKSMLKYDSFSLAHVAKLSGFGNLAYMTRQFSRYLGMPPGQYRKNVK